MIRKKWVVSDCDKDLAADIAEEFSVNPLTAYLLVSRGITDELEIEEFLDPSAPLMADPFLFADMTVAAERISAAIESGERICVFGDYDCDGVTATALLYSYLCEKGADVMNYIPDRMKEGYGLNCDAVRYLNSQGVRLIVTVDNGVSAIEEAKLIYELGMQLIVTDHHKVGDELPMAEAVVDPHRNDCQGEFKELSGVGVAFKLVSAIEGGDEDYVLDRYADLAALGTIGDVVTLRGENRAIVRNGLAMINSSPSVGISALLDKAGASGKTMTATSVAFTLCPRINAAGRMGSASKALDLLLCDDPDIASDIAEEIKVMNTERQKAEIEIFGAVQKMFAAEPALLNEKIIVVSGTDWHQGVIGIVASRIVERYGKPAIVISECSDSSEARGSCRSIEGFSIFDAIESCSDCLTHYGGHMLAAGMGIECGRIDEFRRRINEYANGFEMPFPVQRIDCRINPSSINLDILKALEAIEPFGAGNPQPCFGLYGMTVEDCNPIGEGRHIRLLLSKGGARVTAVCFGTSEKFFPYRKGDKVDIAMNLDRNVYNGEERVTVNIRNVRSCVAEESKILSGQRLYEKVLSGDSLTKEQAQLAFPDRQLLVNTFRTAKAESPLDGDFETLCIRMNDDGENYCRVAVAVNAMLETGVLAVNSIGKLYAPDLGKKVNLEDASIMKKLQQML